MNINVLHISFIKRLYQILDGAFFSSIAYVVKPVLSSSYADVLNHAVVIELHKSSAGLSFSCRLQTIWVYF